MEAGTLQHMLMASTNYEPPEEMYGATREMLILLNLEKFSEPRKKKKKCNFAGNAPQVTHMVCFSPGAPAMPLFGCLAALAAGDYDV